MNANPRQLTDTIGRSVHHKSSCSAWLAGLRSPLQNATIRFWSNSLPRRTWAPSGCGNKWEIACFPPALSCDMQSLIISFMHLVFTRQGGQRPQALDREALHRLQQLPRAAGAASPISAWWHEQRFIHDRYRQDAQHLHWPAARALPESSQSMPATLFLWFGRINERHFLNT